MDCGRLRVYRRPPGSSPNGHGDQVDSSTRPQLLPAGPPDDDGPDAAIPVFGFNSCRACMALSIASRRCSSSESVVSIAAGSAITGVTWIVRGIVVVERRRCSFVPVGR